jgi:VCBS repeat-containing protein
MVTDTNDVAPAITSGATGSEAENAAISNVVYDANATDPDTVGTVTFSLTGTDAGQFAINPATGEVTFLASPNFEAPADADANNLYEVVVHANDGVQDTTQAVTISVTGVNEAPVLSGDLAATVDEGASNTITTADLNFTDPDDNAAGVTFTVTDLTNGTVEVSGVDATSFTGTQLADGEVTFLHDGSETTAASFQVVVEDGNEDTSTPTPSTLNLTVTPVNDAPTATDDSQTTAEDTAVVLGLDDFGSYADVEGSAIAAVRITALESDGSLEYDAGGGSWMAVTLNQEISAADITAGRLRFVPDTTAPTTAESGELRRRLAQLLGVGNGLAVQQTDLLVPESSGKFRLGYPARKPA